jgi:uncharacterized protein (TIGR03435 family)
LESDRFDVVAKIPVNVSTETARAMLRNLLADRFALEVHDDTKPLPAYILTAGKGGLKIKRSSASDSGCQAKLDPPEAAPGVIPAIVMTCRGLTSAELVEAIQRRGGPYFEHPLIDSTKLEGKWDFSLRWTNRGQLQAAGSSGISLFDAIDKQLGLRLNLQNVPTSVIVVDNVSRKPTDNLPGVAENLSGPSIEFEAVDVKPSPPTTAERYMRLQRGGRVDAEGPLKDFIGYAFDIAANLRADTLIGGPSWIETERYAVVAKAMNTGNVVLPTGERSEATSLETPPPVNMVRLMFRALLADRFGLLIHNEDRPTTVYALIASKVESSKLKKADPSERSNCKPDRDAAPMIGFICQNTTIGDLAYMLEQRAGAYFDHPVFDATGLSGGWDFSLRWTGRAQLESASPSTNPNATGSVTAPDPPGGLSIFQAVERSLGLKLEKQTHTVPVVVIDTVEHLLQ